MESLLYGAALIVLIPPLMARLLPRLRERLDFSVLPWVAMLAQVAALVWAGVRRGHLPLDTFQHGLGALSLLLVAGWLVLRRRPRMDLLGAVLLGLAAVMLSLGLVAPGDGYSGDTELNSLWFVLHILLMLTGFLGFALAFSISGLYLLVRRRLKSRRLRGIGRLPSLDTLDRLNLRSMALGFVALTLGMVVGGLWASTRPETDLGPDITIYATLAVWLWYAAGLHVRLIIGWRGRLAAIFGVVGFGGLAVLLGLAMLMLHGWHGFGG